MKKDLNHPKPKSIYYQQKASSGIQKQAITFGKKLVQELKLEPGVDTLSRWMAHYISEQITIAENSTGQAKSEAETKCFETILKIWEHRSSLPDRSRPFFKFDQIFNVLQKLDHQNHRLFYNDIFDRELQSLHNSDLGDERLKDVVDSINLVDQSARIIIRNLLKKASDIAIDEETIKVLSGFKDFSDGDDIRTIFDILDDEAEIMLNKDNSKKESKKKSNIISKIEQINSLISISKKIKNDLKKELEEIV